MGQIAEIFNNSLMRALAAQAEEKRFQQEFAYRDQRAKEEDAFRQLQFNQTVAMADEANKDRDRSYELSKQQFDLSQRSAAFKEYTKYDPTAPYAKYLGKNEGISGTEFAKLAGITDGSINANDRYIGEKILGQAQYGYMLDRQLAIQDAKEQQENQRNIDAMNVFNKTYSAPELEYGEKTVSVPHGALSPVAEGIDRIRFFPKIRDTWNYLFSDTNAYKTSIPGDPTSNFLFDMNDSIESDNSITRQEKFIKPESIANRANYLASAWNEQKQFVGKKGNQGYAKGMSTTFNELIDLASLAGNSELPGLNKEALAVVNEFRPRIAEGQRLFESSLQKQMDDISSRLKGKEKDSPGYAEAMQALQELVAMKSDPRAAINFIKDTYSKRLQ